MNADNFFTKIENTQPFFKMAAQGQAGTGKSFTLALVAIGLHKFIKSEKPIVLFDTEMSAKFLRPMFNEAEIKVELKQSRTLNDLMTAMDFCDNGGADVMMIDSITHVYEGFLEAYKQKKGRSQIQFQDWGFIKPTWKREFSDRFVMGRYHNMFTGREGYTYDYEQMDNGKKELVKTGTKMKVEGETAYEPDCLIRMARFELLGKDGKLKVWREATVIKGRSQVIDGKVFRDPTFEDFKPEIEFLLTDVTNPTKTVTHGDDELIGDEENRREDREARKIMLERNDDILNEFTGGTSADAKVGRIALKRYAYHGETSDTAIAAMTLGQLTEANERLQKAAKGMDRVQRGEKAVYADDKAALKARKGYFGTAILGQAAEEGVDNLEAYVQELAAIVKKQKEEKAA